MLIRPRRGQVGRAGPDDSLVELVMACHARIRRFTAMAVTLAAPATQGRPAAEIADGADAVRRYLAVALPLHVADEDASITPRLRGRAPEVDAALARMHAEHEGHAPLLEAVIELCAAIARAPGDQAALAPARAPAAGALEAALLAHLEEEERVILPAIAALPAAEQAAIVAELRARRA